jgi:hypothetical protein
MAVLVGVTLEGSGGGSDLALDIPAAVLSLALIALLRRWPVPVALLLSALAALSPVATPPATLAALIVARWRSRPVALAIAGAGIGAHLIRGAWRPIAEGQTNAEIAAPLLMSVPTVKAHVTHILTKAGLANRTQIALLAHDAGLA